MALTDRPSVSPRPWIRHDRHSFSRKATRSRSRAGADGPAPRRLRACRSGCNACAREGRPSRGPDGGRCWTSTSFRGPSLEEPVGEPCVSRLLTRQTTGTLGLSSQAFAGFGRTFPSPVQFRAQHRLSGGRVLHTAVERAWQSVAPCDPLEQPGNSTMPSKHRVSVNLSCVAIREPGAIVRKARVSKAWLSCWATADFLVRYVSRGQAELPLWLARHTMDLSQRAVHK